MSSEQSDSAEGPKHGPSGMSIMAADVFRLLVDLAAHGAALVPAGVVFVWLWQTGRTPLQVAAFPAAFIGLVVGFWTAVLVLRLLFLRRIRPGAYDLRRPEAIPWILADSLMRLIQRSPLHGYIDDFGPVRYVFYRLLGARIDSTFFFGWDAKVLDPWLLEVGRDVIIGSFAVISGHSVEGQTVVLEPVKIGDGATIGVRSIILPGVEVGEGAIVGAGALVAKGTKVPPGEVWAGVPARRIGSTGD